METNVSRPVVGFPAVNSLPTGPPGPPCPALSLRGAQILSSRYGCCSSYLR